MTESIRGETEEAGAGLSRLPHRRTDWYSARTVECAVELQARQGTQAAAAFMKSKSIVADIAIRTLLHPDQRRGS